MLQLTSISRLCQSKSWELRFLVEGRQKGSATRFPREIFIQAAVNWRPGSLFPGCLGYPPLFRGSEIRQGPRSGCQVSATATPRSNQALALLAPSLAMRNNQLHRSREMVPSPPQEERGVNAEGVLTLANASLAQQPCACQALLGFGGKAVKK